MNIRQLHVIWALLLVLAFAAPMAPAWVLCESEAAAAEVCPDNDCDPSDCPEGTGGCAQCGQLGKILAATTNDDLSLPPALPWVFSGLSPCAQEGFIPVIDQPPRNA